MSREEWKRKPKNNPRFGLDFENLIKWAFHLMILKVLNLFLLIHFHSSWFLSKALIWFEKCWCMLVFKLDLVIFFTWMLIFELNLEVFVKKVFSFHDLKFSSWFLKSIFEKELDLKFSWMTFQRSSVFNFMHVKIYAWTMICGC